MAQKEFDNVGHPFSLNFFLYIGSKYIQIIVMLGINKKILQTCINKKILQTLTIGLPG